MESDIDEYRLLEDLLKRSETNSTLIIANDYIDLNYEKDKIIYIIEVEMGNSAGGRVGGFGSRRFKKIYGFKVYDKQFKRIVESHDTEGLEVYNIVRMPITLSNGEEIMISCSIDQDMVYMLNRRFGI